MLLLGDGDAFMGDLLLGGYLGGAMFSCSPGTHYYHDDRPAAEAQICVVIRAGARHLYLGHGGPVSARTPGRNSAAGKARCRRSALH